MSNAAIIADGIGKRYHIGARLRRAGTLSEALTAAVPRKARDLQKMFRRYPSSGDGESKEFWALRDVSFTVPRGQVLGIIGRNGSGKSTLLKILSRITPPTEGEAAIAGRVGSLLEIGTGFHSELTGRENIYLSGMILGMKRYEIDLRFDEIVDFSGVEQFIETPVKHYSSGMYLRLAFAVAAHLRTEILLIDEVLSVGDASFQRKCIEKMSDVARSGRTVLFVSHNLGAVSRLCECGLLMEAGHVAGRGAIDEVVAAYGRLVSSRNEEIMSEGRDKVEVYGFQVKTDDVPVGPSTPLTFSFEIVTARDYWNLLMQLGLITHEGLNLVLAVVDSERFPELRRPGRHRVEITLPALWLKPRNYAARIKVIGHPGSGTTERFYSEWVEIAVEGGSASEDVSDCVLVPHADWKVKTLEQ